MNKNTNALFRGHGEARIRFHIGSEDVWYPQFIQVILDNGMGAEQGFFQAPLLRAFKDFHRREKFFLTVGRKLLIFCIYIMNIRSFNAKVNKKLRASTRPRRTRATANYRRSQTQRVAGRKGKLYCSRFEFISCFVERDFAADLPKVRLHQAPSKRRRSLGE